MDTNTAKWVTCIVMCLLVVGGMAYPAIRDMTEPNKTYTNWGTAYSLTDEGDHTITLSAGDKGFLIDSGNGPSTIDGYLFYAPEGKGTAAAIGIGVYEAYNRSGTLVSQPGVMPTVSQNPTAFRNQAIANNQGNDESVFQLWNYYNYTLYKIMATTIMGDSDSQYVMGYGKSSGDGPNMTGLTTSAYHKSETSSDSVCLLLENVWGSAWDLVGETYTNDRYIAAGNTLGGMTLSDSMNNVIGESIRVPSSVNRGFITSIATDSDAWGTPITASTSGATAHGLSPNDCVWTVNTAGLKCLLVGATWRDAERGGLYSISTANVATWVSEQMSTRLSCYLDDNILSGKPYAYQFTSDNKGAISSVLVRVDGEMVETMPDDTTLNPYWGFGSDGVGPFNVYYAALNLTDGDNLDDEGQDRLSKKKGEIAYVLNPNDLTRTLKGYEFDPTLYNVMLIIPTVYWYCDTSAGTVYMGSSPDAFEGITMTAYGHNFTKSDNTGTIGFHSVKEFAYGNGLIFRISDLGEVTVLDETASTVIGTVGWDSPLTLSVSGESVSCNETVYDGLWAYLDKGGDHVLATNGRINDGSVFVMGGYGDITTASDVPVSIGYVLKGDYSQITDTTSVYPVADTITLDPSLTKVSLHGDWSKYLTTIEDVSIRSVWSDGSASVMTLDKAIVPRTLVYHNDSSDDKMLNTLVMMIPVLVLFAIIMAIAYYGFGRERRF